MSLGCWALSEDSLERSIRALDWAYWSMVKTYSMSVHRLHLDLAERSGNAFGLPSDIIQLIAQVLVRAAIYA